MVGGVNLQTWLNGSAANLFEQPVRISNGGRYCSGMLIAPDLESTTKAISTPLVLTCAHFFRTAPLGAFNVRGHKLRQRLAAVRVIDGTDIAIAHLQGPASPRQLLGVGNQFFYPGKKTATFGFGGNSTHAVVKAGTVITPSPISFSRGGHTRVRPAAIQFNTPKAIKGDSGGAVLSMGAHDVQPTINAVQSLILDPIGFNLGLATVAQLRPHKKALQQAAQSLLAMNQDTKQD